MRRVAIFTLLTLGAIPKAPAQTPDALTILKRSQDAIANLKSFEIKGFMVIETSNADYEQTLKSKFVLASEQPGKFRVDVRTPGSMSIVADGKQTWTFNPMLKQFTSNSSVPSLVNALQSSPVNLLLPNPPGQTVKSAKLTGEANLDVGGVPHPCYLLDVESAASKFSKFWVDKSTWLVLKRTLAEHMLNLPLSGIPADMKMSLQVESLTVNQLLSSELFTFVPPTGSKLVEKFEFSGMTPSNLTGKHSIDFKLKDLSDHEFQLANYKGKTVLLDFWATWCGPCRAEIPALNKLHQDNPDLIVLGIDVGEDADIVQKFVIENKITYPILLAGHDGVVNDYAAQALPTVVVIDKDGDIRSYKVGYERGGDEQLRTAVIEAG
ncbi:MAG: redoxin domain-containing protein, partial [Acidobacteriota bacterium]|nr:redoxin domain-containing protein [Acidobacteriota bacterium]